VIEVTERSIIHLDGDVLATMAALRRRGFGIAVDDLGTGFSSLAHLLDVPADAVKIDQRFVRGLPHDPRSVALVRGLLRLADGLGDRAVAEGVETTAQHELLDRLGCEQFQGYLESPAMAPDVAITWLAARGRDGVPHTRAAADHS
jgi:EAL domain-containing protein (putative c-di-GMP-specific phosphodiesterase class I)